MLSPSHSLSRQGAIITLLKQTEEMLGDVLQKREEGGEEGVVVDNGRDYGRKVISADPGLDLDRQHQELGIKCNSQEPHSAATPFTISPEKFGGRFQEADTEVRSREIKSKPGSPNGPLDGSTSLARGTGTGAGSSHSDPMPAKKGSVVPQNPRDSEIGIALGARDSSLGAQVGPEWCSLGVGSEWRLRLESQADAVLSKPSLPQAPLVEQGSVATLVETPESRKLQIPTPNPCLSSKSLSTPAPQPLTSLRNVGQVKVTCLTPTTHRESFITATEEGMHRGEVSGSSGALSPFSPGWDFTGGHSLGRSSYQSTRGETVQYGSGTEEGYESEISQTTFATDPGFMTPRSATPTDTGCLDSKQKPAQDLSHFNRALLKTEVELAMKTLLYGLAGQVGSPKGLYWDSC